MNPWVLAVFVFLIGTVNAAEKASAGTGEFFKGPLGLQMYSLRFVAATNAMAALDQAQAFGFHLLESGPGRMSPDEYLKVLAARDLKIVSTFADYGRLKTNIESVISSAQKLGLKYVICGWVPHEKAAFNEKNAREAAAVFNAAGEKLKAAGITFAFHIHGYEFQPYGDGTLFDLLVRETRPEFVSFELDVFWAAQGGADPAALLEKYPARFKLMHVKDLRKGAEINHTGSAPDSDSVPVGQGQINWPAVLKAAQRARVEVYFIEDEAKNAVEQIPVTLRYLEQVSW